MNNLYNLVITLQIMKPYDVGLNPTNSISTSEDSGYALPKYLHKTYDRHLKFSEH